LQQLDEIVLVIHEQNPVRHAAKLAGSAPTTMTTGLKRSDEMETENFRHELHEFSQIDFI
jgi:hypothetical protein